MSSRSTSSAWVKGIVDMLVGVGVQVEPILAAAGIAAEILDHPDDRVPTEKVSLLWWAAAHQSGNPAIGLARAHVPKPGNFDIVGYTMLSSRNLHEALVGFARHLRLVSDAAEIHLEPLDGAIRLQLKLDGGSEPIPRQRMEFDLLTILTFCRWVAGREIKPLSLEMVWAAPADLAPFEEAFQCPLHFDAEVNGVVFSRADLDRDLPAFNTHVAAAHQGLIQRRLAAFDGPTVSAKTREEIARRLHEGEPRREQIAKRLGMTNGVLQLRLREEGSSFQQVLDDTRRQLAWQYLARLDLSLAEVAYLLGFSDQSAFFRASKRWFDAPPGQFRLKISSSSRPPSRPPDANEVGNSPADKA
jgi:AraC-like DNA-binding protein